MPNLFKCELCGKLLVFGKYETEPYNIFKHVASHQDEAYYRKVKVYFNGGESKPD